MAPSRRQTIVGLGGLLAAGGAAIGTGAFDAVEAERTVTVETTGDASAFLGIEPADGAGPFVDDSGETIVVDIGGTETDAGGQGVNENAITAIDQLLEVTNNGTQDVEVGFNNQYAVDEGDYSEDELPGPWGYAVSDESAAAVLWASPDDIDHEEHRPELVETGFTGSTLVDLRFGYSEFEEPEKREIAPGESVNVGIVVDTRESTIEENSLPDELDETVTLFAETSGD